VSLPPPGTLARRRAQDALDAVCVAMKQCPHDGILVVQVSATGRTREHRCTTCQSLRQLDDRQHGRWSPVWKAT